MCTRQKEISLLAAYLDPEFYQYLSDRDKTSAEDLIFRKFPGSVHSTRRGNTCEDFLDFLLERE